MPNSITVLIADTDVSCATRLKNVCDKTTDVQVLTTVHSGNRVLAAVKKHKPDVLVTELLLPYMDGLSVITALQTLPPVNRPHVIVWSAALTERAITACWQCGAAYFLLKPCDPDCVLARIRSLSSATVAPVCSSSDAAICYNTVVLSATRLLHLIGIPANTNGHNYLRDAITHTVLDGSYARGITTRLYPLIARQYNATPPRVERAIRHAIEYAYTHGDRDSIYRYFDYIPSSTDRRPSNAAFICMAADRLRLQAEQ